jgi:hypothetical protein
MTYNFTPGSVLYDNTDHEARLRTRVVVDIETGLPLIITTQNVRPIIEANKKAANGVDRHVQRRRRLAGSGMTHIASIPRVVWRQLVEQGVTRDERRLLKWLSERDHRFFRVDDGKKLA